MKGIAVACVVAALAVLSGCATPGPIDVSQSDGSVTKSVIAKSRPQIASIEIQDATTPSQAQVSVFANTDVPLKEKTSETVAADIRRYFAASTQVNSASDQRIVVRIESAEVHSVIGISKQIPVVSLFTLGMDSEYYMNLRVSLEVERAGKVEKTFSISERYSIPDGKTATQDGVAESYQRMIALYRQRFFTDLDGRFTCRYLE